MMNLTQASSLATAIKEILAPYCDRIEIAGSIRRKKTSGIKDVEIVAIPSQIEVETDLFGGTAMMRHPDLVKRLQQADIVKGDPRTGKYIQFNTKWKIEGKPIKCDLFFATLENWGYIYCIRTGSEKFSKFMANAWKGKGLQGKDGMLYWRSGSPQPIREEKELFQLLRINYVDPINRNLI